jgi:hypothetical protein
MAKLVSALRHHPLESGGSSRQLGGRILSLKWGAIALLFLLIIITAIAINMLLHQAAAKQDAATAAPVSQKNEALPARVSPPADVNANSESSQSVSTQVTSNGSRATTNVTVNGKQVPVPANGTVQKEVTDDNGNKAEVNISSTSSQSESSVDSSINVNVSSEQSTTEDSQ